MEAILVSWQAVANDFQIAMVFQCALSTVDFTITIEIFKLNIARTIYEVTCLDAFLIGNTGLVIPTSVGIFAGGIIGGELTIGLKAPNVAPCFAFVSIGNVVGVSDNPLGVVPFLHFYFRIADAEVGIQSKVFLELFAPC